MLLWFAFTGSCPFEVLDIDKTGYRLVDIAMSAFQRCLLVKKQAGGQEDCFTQIFTDLAEKSVNETKV